MKSFFLNCFFHNKILLAILVSLSHPSCLGVEEGDAEVTTDASEKRTYCEQHLEAVELDDNTSLSLSAQEVLDALWGTWQCVLDWQNVKSAGTLSPREHPAQATISLLYEGGALVDNSSERIAGDIDVDLICTNQLEISSILKIESSDGYLSESFPVTATIADRSGAKIDLSIGLKTYSSQFRGTYNFVPNESVKKYPNSGTKISFSFSTDDSSPASGRGSILEWFESAVYIEDIDDNPGLGSNGAAITTVEFECLRP